jgi:ATPase subunit of ABC transporter with duplicated ATPase domains
MDPGAVAALTRLLVAARDARGVLVISHDRSLLQDVCTHIVNVGTW